MFDISAGTLAIVGFGLILAGVLSGFPIAWILGGIAVITGFFFWGPRSFDTFYQQMYGLVSNYILLAIPLFIFMGAMIEESGIGKRLFDTMYVIFGRLRGGIAITAVVVGTMLATILGIIAGSTVMLTIVALPNLLRHKYNKAMSCGTICASGSLGIFIPPSILLIIYGPVSGISVGKLFMGAFMPGFMLSGLYITYILIRSFINPHDAPSVPTEEQIVSLRSKIRMFVTSALPLLVLIFSVLGVIYTGIAAPTEAAAMGAVASILIAAFYRRLNYATLKSTSHRAFDATVMVIYTCIGAAMFQSVFMALGGGEYFTEMVLSAPGGRWGSFVVIMFIILFLGMFIPDIAIILIMVPLVTPIAEALGFHPVWFAMMVCMDLQTSFMTPSLGITTGDIIKGVIPFIFLIVVGMGLCVAFPQIITWLPGTMIK
jgi:tripartite ATP-independent transporter DctM subunit